MRVEDIPRSALAKCGACKADIIWTKTAAGEDMPVDLAEGGYVTTTTTKHGRDTVKTVTANIGLTVVGTTVESRVVKSHLAFGNTSLHLAHWVRCPHSKLFRRRNAAPRKASRR